MLKKLRIRFICVLMSVVTLMMGLVMGFVIRFTMENLEQETENALQNAASDPGFLPLHHESASSLPYFVIQPDPQGYLRIRGTIFFERYGDGELQSFWETAAASESGEIEGYNLRYRRFSTPMGDKLVFVDTTSNKLVLGNLIRTCIIAGAAGLLFFLGVSFLLAKWTVKPVEQAWQQQKQFVADASHELKSPLTVIMTNAELLTGQDCDGESRRRFASGILTMSQQMKGLVEGLLELARVDNGAVRTCFEKLELSTLVEERIMLFEPLYFEKGISLASGVQKGFFVKASESHLGQVVDILLDNALKYSVEAGAVTVALRRQGTCCILSVANPGEAISPEDLKNIFKRFYRIDKARSRNGSYGLGLSIAECIVTEHGGKIWAQSSGGVNTFFVQLPLRN